MFTCITQPLLQQRFQLTHVLKAQVESFKSGDGGLAEVIAVQFAHSHAHVALRKIQDECQRRTRNTHTYTLLSRFLFSLPFTCVNPSLMRLCLKVRANCSSSSRSLGSSLT